MGLVWRQAFCTLGGAAGAALRPWRAAHRPLSLAMGLMVSVRRCMPCAPVAACCRRGRSLNLHGSSCG